MLDEAPHVARCLVAYSAGRDSLALLHATARLREQSGSPEVRAVHVHHGLHAEADTWAEHCRRVCRTLGVDLDVVEIDARARAGESPEAAARRSRYAALAARVDAHSAVLTAHHRRDQAETVLLQLLRGAGPRGLAGMPRAARLGAGWLLRPFLDLPASLLEEYARALDLGWVEDPTNADARFDRNYIRHEILPRLEDRWSAAARTLAGAASLQAEAAEIVAEQASRDMRRARGSEPGTLAASALGELTPARAHALLRAWIEARSLSMPGRASIERILLEVVRARRDASPLVAWPGGEVRRYRDDLYAAPPLPRVDPSLTIAWRPPCELALPLGRLLAVGERGSGLDASRCAGGRVEVRFRRGGERCRPAGRSHRRYLKKLLQDFAVPPWLRDRLPLVYVDGELAAVAGQCVCEGYQAGAGQCGWKLVWDRREHACEQSAGARHEA